MLQLYPQYAINTGSRIHSTSRCIIPLQPPCTYLCPVSRWKGSGYIFSWSLDRHEGWAGVGSSSLWDVQPSSSFFREQSVPRPDNVYQVSVHSEHLSSQGPAAWTPVQKHLCQKCTCISSSPSSQHYFYRYCGLWTSPDAAAACCKRSMCQNCFFSPSLMNRHIEVILGHGLDGGK